ncbi:MAG: carboxypeptidase regulatory-like domain-containing protein [Planctomycetes bacterium]|nr:carboxypeptidase regulatory-like domain-containing protein [Planctomycetota bacterium]
MPTTTPTVTPTTTPTATPTPTNTSTTTDATTGLPAAPTPTGAGVGAIQGVVRDGRGQPVGGATVEGVDPASPERALATATTGPDGAYRLEGLGAAGSDVRLRVRAPRRAPAWREARTLADGPVDVDLVLEDGLALEGTVVGEGGVAVAEAQVEIVAWTDGHLPSDPCRTVRADAAGRFLFDDLGDSWYLVRAQAPGHLPSVAEPARPGARGVELRLRRPARLAVQVRSSEEGVLLGEARVVFRWGPYVDRRSGRSLDGDGRLELGDLEPGPLHLLIFHPRSATLERELELSPSGTNLDLVLEAGGAIEGVVRDGAGVPVATNVWRFHPEVEVPSDWAPTDDEGRFRLEGLPVGPVLLAVRVPDSPRHPEVVGPIDVPSGDTAAWKEITLDLHRVGQLVVTVVDTTGGPLPGALVTVQRLSQEPRATEVSDASGRVDLDLPAGRVRVKASLPGVPEAAAEAEVTAGAETQVELRLAARGDSLARLPDVPSGLHAPDLSLGELLAWLKGAYGLRVSCEPAWARTRLKIQPETGDTLRETMEAALETHQLHWLAGPAEAQVIFHMDH